MIENARMRQQITCRQVEVVLGRYRLEYEWPMDEVTTFVSYKLLENLPYESAHFQKRGNTFWLGHLHLLIVDFVPVARMWEVALVSGRGYQRLYARQLYYFFDKIYRRCIMTLHVWALAEVPYGGIPSWRHIKGLGRGEARGGGSER